MSDTLALLTRAHKHLTEKRDKATKGPWEVDESGDISAPRSEHSPEWATSEWVVAGDSGAFVVSGEDADLIELLHRTIDAQLEVLAEACAEVRADPDYWPHMGHRDQIEVALDLARAILGEDA